VVESVASVEASAEEQRSHQDQLQFKKWILKKRIQSPQRADKDSVPSADGSSVRMGLSSVVTVVRRESEATYAPFTTSYITIESSKYF
jgi:hypothetical protein